MKQRIAAKLIRLARHIDPNCCVDFHPLPVGQAVIKVNYIGPEVDVAAALERRRKYEERLAGLTPG